MAKQTGFLEYKREEPKKRLIAERIRDFRELEELLPSDRINQQAARCMDCGTPFCHAFGCPVANRIPDWNDMVYQERWEQALTLLQATDNFPEFTGRVCPALCEAACTLAIQKEAVSIKQIELQIVERGWQEGWIKPEPALYQTGKRVAVIGSGPAGLAAAQQLARNGHSVVVFEKADRIGGILRYGIPDFKLEKWVIDRRLEQLRQEGIIFETGVEAGVDLSIRYMRRTYDAIVIATGSNVPRDLKIPGRDLKNIHFAMDFLTQQNRRLEGDSIEEKAIISAKDKKVLVIGGGDTGSDCVGTSRRQGASQIVQIELLPQPPADRDSYNPWPTWPNIMRSSSSHEEGCERIWSIQTKEFIGSDQIEKVKVVRLDWSPPDENGRRKFTEIPDSEFEIEADLVLLAMGFVHPEHGPLVSEASLKLDDRGNIEVDKNQMTSVPGIFAAGDCVLGASLVVRALDQGRKVADGVEQFLAGR
ncbi:glutamate synthase subunit beta [candidate division KSB1 bacterium]|nr:glutamate synthase subunit beta [candidate division KSB1 bacterium]